MNNAILAILLLSAGIQATTPEHRQTAAGAVSVTLPNEAVGDVNVVIVQLSTPANPVKLVWDTLGNNYTLVKSIGDVQIWVSPQLIQGGSAVILTSGSTKQIIASEYSGVSDVDDSIASVEGGFLFNIPLSCSSPTDELVWYVEAATPFTWPYVSVWFGWPEWKDPFGKAVLMDAASSNKTATITQRVTSVEADPACYVLALSLKSP